MISGSGFFLSLRTAINYLRFLLNNLNINPISNYFA